VAAQRHEPSHDDALEVRMAVEVVVSVDGEVRDLARVLSLQLNQERKGARGEHSDRAVLEADDESCRVRK
jgi:hypothetical protein